MDPDGRPVKRQRVVGVGDDEWTSAAQANDSSSSSSHDQTNTADNTSPRRAAATIERTAPEEIRQSIHLTVKAAPSKLREATSGNSAATNQPHRKVGVNSRGNLIGGKIVAGQHSSRITRAIIEQSSEDDLDDDEDDGDVNVDDEDDEDIEDGEDDDDEVMEDLPPTQPRPPGKVRAKQQQSSESAGALVVPELPSVGAQDIAIEGDRSQDDELSELDSAVEEDEENGEVEDAEGEEDALENETDSDQDTSVLGSRAGTPDLSKLTRRQRAAFETYDGELISLSNEAQKKKHLTAEEHAMRRTEMARRRKNLSEKRNEEEKMDTINRLLKKQARKRRGKNQTEADAAGEEQEVEGERAPAAYARYVHTATSSRMAVPLEWLNSPLGLLIAKSRPAALKEPFARRMVSEVER